MTDKRMRAEKRIFEMMDTLDPSGYNTNLYKQAFSKMSDAKFKQYMAAIRDKKEHLILAIDTFGDSISLTDIFANAKKLGIKTHQYVIYPHRNTENPDNPPVSPTPVPILTIPVRRLQQILDKKNSASSNTDVINPITGQVTGDSKSAAITDTLTYALVATGMNKCVKEFHGPRSDDPVSKMQMLREIERNGDFELKDLNLNVKNKQSIETMKVFMRGAGFKVTVK